MALPAPSTRSPIDVRHGASRPVLLSVPHSGRDYSVELLARARLGRASLERLEDPRVDELVQGALDRGVGAVIARAPRAAIDCNRGEDEFDPRSVAGRRGAGPTERARAGLGLIPTRLAGVGELWRSPIDEAELARRLDTIHRPYHAAIARSLDDLARAWGEILLIDCHSMPQRRAGEAQVVIGDRHGLSAAPWLSEAALEIAGRMGFGAVRNIPFAGGHVVARHGRPARGRHALQVEVDRSAYCQRDGFSPGPGFDRVARLFEALTIDLGDLLAQRRLAAAE